MNDKWKQLDEQLVALARVRYRYDVLNPINTQEEYETFLAHNGAYNPQFKYNTVDVSDEIQALKQLDIPTNTALGELFSLIRDDLLEEAKALQQLGTDTFLVSKAYGELSNEELASIYQLLAELYEEQQLAPDEETVSATAFGKRIEEKLQQYSLDGWTITYSPHALSRASISKDTKIITIKEDERFTEKDIQKLLIHEIETHVLRWQNGVMQPYSIFSVGTHQYLATEEGLAWYNETSQSVANEYALRGFAIMALASHLAKTKSFADIYKSIQPHVQDDEKAYRIVTRVKRGLGDTSKPGGYLKDHTYYQGAKQIESFVANGGNITDLYAGKITIEDIQLLSENIIKPAQILPEFLK
jgi:hypothetical protein